MAEVILFHHAQGLTPGVVAFAEDLRGAGHTVHTPDLYEGRTFDDLEAGVAHAEREIGFGTIVERGRAAASHTPEGVVYAGLSLGALPAMALAQTRAGARGALLLHSAIPLGEFADDWPVGLPLEIHVMEDDAWGDVPVARGLAETIDTAELFLYPGDRHLFTDRSLPAYAPEAAGLVLDRVQTFLERTD